MQSFAHLQFYSLQLRSLFFWYILHLWIFSALVDYKEKKIKKKAARQSVLETLIESLRHEDKKSKQLHC